MNSKRAANSFHQAAEGFLNPKEKQIQQWLDFTPPPKPSIKPDRSAPIENSWKNQIDSVRRNLANKNKQQAQEEWGKLSSSWKDNLKIQQLFADKN
jgi:hypothetical protein